MNRRLINRLVAENMGRTPPEGFVQRGNIWEKEYEEVDIEARSISTYKRTWPADYMRDMNAAKSVLYFWRGLGVNVWVGSDPDSNTRWCCDWWMNEADYAHEEDYLTADQPEEAVCLAFLKFRGVDIEALKGHSE